MRPFQARQEIVSRSGRETIDDADHLRTFLAQRAAGLRRQFREHIGKDVCRAAPVGVCERRARNPAGAEVIVMMTVGVPRGLEFAQALHIGELSVDHGDEMIPAAERFVIGLGLVTRRGCPKKSP